MKNKNSLPSPLFGGIAGILSITSYLTLAFTDLPIQITFLLALLFRIGGIIFIFCLKEYIAIENDSWVNHLGFTFGSLAYCILAIFISAQLSVNSGFELDSKLDPATVTFVKGAVRMVDIGIDVAWDMFIGTYLIAFVFASNGLRTLRIWGITGGLLGLALIVLNVSTFPTPPAEAELIDLGPFIGIFLLALGFKLATLKSPGVKEANQI